MPDDGAHWSVGLAAWVIKDGNYDDFSVGDRAEFAVEFYAPEEPQITTDQLLRAEDLGDGQYEVTARVAHLDERGWVLDFGIKAYRDAAPPRGVRAGDIVQTRLTLGVDPFFYFEDLARNLDWPDLIYTWDVREVWRETAPFISKDNVLVRDEGKRKRVSVPRTDAWHDDGGHGDYVFVCKLAELEPKRHSATAR